MFNKYAIEIQDRSRALCTFLNDGIEIPSEFDGYVLFCEINNPREITSKILRHHEMMGENFEDTLFIKP